MSGVAGRRGTGDATSREMFRARMESQCREIDLYRHAVMRASGRILSRDEAALEWIARYAAEFDRDSEIHYG